MPARAKASSTPAEQMVARRALRLGDRTVREIMRPRIEIDALDVDTPADEVIGAVAMAGFSRLPVHEGDLDHIIGFIYTKDLLLRQHMGWPIELRKLVRPALLVPETMPIDKLLELFREKRTQMAIVLDEFGGTEGLVTMEDVLEELVGEIHDEYRQDREQEIVQRDDEQLAGRCRRRHPRACWNGSGWNAWARIARPTSARSAGWCSRSWDGFPKWATARPGTTSRWKWSTWTGGDSIG